jgi:hypothetical protein
LLRPYPVEDERIAVEEARGFLQDILADGEKPAKEVFSEAKKAGISEATLKRARAGLVRSHKADVTGGKRGEAPWVWTLVQGDQGGDDHALAVDELLYRSVESVQNQSIALGNKEAHVSAFNGNGNYQKIHVVKTDDKEAHPMPVRHARPDDRLKGRPGDTQDGWPYPSQRGDS